MTKKKLTVAEILKRNQLRHETLSVDDWDGDEIEIRELSAAEKFEFSQAAGLYTPQPNQVLFLKLSWAACLVEPTFTAEETDALFAESMRGLDQVLGAIKRLNKLNETAQVEAENSFRDDAGEVVPVSTGETAGEDGS